MLELEHLLQTIADPTRKPASPQVTPSSTAKEYAGNQPASYPQAPANHPQAPAPAGDMRVARVDAGNLPARDNSALDAESDTLAGLRVGSGISGDEDDPRTGRLRVMRVDAGNLPARANNVQDEENPNHAGLRVGSGVSGVDTNPWTLALSQADPLAARLVELQPPVLRVDVDGRARGYRPLKGLAPQQVHQLVRWTLEALSHQYPTPPSLAVIAQWPGAYPTPTTNTPLWSWQAEHQPEPEPAPQLMGWAASLLEDADRLQVQYPVLLVLLAPEPETKSLSRLASSRHHLARVLGELSRYTPREARLLKPGTLEPLGRAHG